MDRIIFVIFQIGSRIKSDILLSVCNLVCGTGQSQLQYQNSKHTGGMQDFGRGQLSDCNSLSSSNPLINRVLNKKINIYSYLIKKY
jgi:hypothetical protein